MRFLLIAALFLTGCVTTKSSNVFLEQNISSPRVIALNGSRAPWVFEIEKRLRNNDFKIKRMASQNAVVENVSSSKTDIYNKASARYILNVDGYAPNNSMERCFGGGYNFNYITVELIDVRNNETVLHYSNSGYSENCPPLSGTIFGDIESLVVQNWD